MRIVLQRVSAATLHADGENRGTIGKGLVLLVGIAPDDDASDVDWCLRRIRSLRIFDDPDGRMNLDLASASGSLAVVSQFTLFADLRKGTKPSFHRAASPDHARKLFDALCLAIGEASIPAITGIFGARMEIDAVQEGPVTLILDSKSISCT